MAVERKFLEESLKKVKIDRFIRSELKAAGVGDVQVKRTPLGTRVTIEAVKPGLLIGRKGKNIQDLTTSIKTKFTVENPQVEVAEVPIPEFNPGIMAQRLVQALENHVHFRRACHNMLNEIMKRGALGAMIIVSGKISGARARSERFKAGYIRYCGEPTLEYVKEATTFASLKPGRLGVKVKIMPPIENPSDELGLRKVPLVMEAEAISPESKPAEIKAEAKAAPKKRAPKKKAEGAVAVTKQS